MKKFNLVTTKSLDNYGVAFFNSERDYLILHFDGFKKQDAKEIVRFCNVVIGKVAEQMSENNCARVIQVGNSYYVTKNFERENGDTLFFSSHGLKNEITACRCAAILETVLNTEDNADDKD